MFTRSGILCYIKMKLHFFVMVTCDNLLDGGNKTNLRVSMRVPLSQSIEHYGNVIVLVR